MSNYRIPVSPKTFSIVLLIMLPIVIFVFVKGEQQIVENEKKKVYTVKFDSQLDYGPLFSSTVTVRPNRSVSNLPFPAKRKGYSFGGWFFYSEGIGIEFTTNMIITNNMKIYAKWVERIKL